MKSIRRWFIGWFLSILFISFFYSTTFAQASPLNSRIEEIDSQSFPQVKAFLSITDSQGFSITGLEQTAFAASEDNQPIVDFQVTPFRNENQPLAIVLIMDVSGSMAGAPLKNSVAAAKDFIATLTPNDQIALIAFSTKPVVLADLTTNQTLITEALDGLKAEGDTAHYDAIVEAINLLKNRSERRVIVSLTDGKESGISAFDFDQVINEAVRWSVPIYPIGFGGVNQEELDRLAKLTGGFSQVQPDSTTLTTAFINVLDNLRQQYLVEFDSALKADGVEHELAITVSHQGGAVTTTKKFIAHPGQVIVSLPGFTDGQEVSGKLLFEPEILAPAPVARLEITVDGQPLTSILEQPFNHAWDSTAIAEGEHVFEFTVTDTAGNTGSQLVTLNIQSPIRIIPNLVEDQAVSGEVLVSAEVVAPAGVTRVNFFVDDQPLAEITSPPYETTWNTKGVSPGYHILKLTGADVNGFTTETQVRVNVEIQSSSSLLWLAAIVILVAAGILVPLSVSRNKKAKNGKAMVGTPPVQDAAKATLIEKEGMNPGMVWQLGAQEVRLGRKRDENDIPLKGLQASRHQAVIRLQPEGYVLHSLSPENPMLINDTPAAEQAVLKHGDVLRAGESQFVFEVLS